MNYHSCGLQYYIQQIMNIYVYSILSVERILINPATLFITIYMFRNRWELNILICTEIGFFSFFVVMSSIKMLVNIGL